MGGGARGRVGTQGTGGGVQGQRGQGAQPLRGMRASFGGPCPVAPGVEREACPRRRRTLREDLSCTGNQALEGARAGPAQQRPRRRRPTWAVGDPGAPGRVGRLGRSWRCPGHSPAPHASPWRLPRSAPREPPVSLAVHRAPLAPPASGSGPSVAAAWACWLVGGRPCLAAVLNAAAVDPSKPAPVWTWSHSLGHVPRSGIVGRKVLS